MGPELFNVGSEAMFVAIERIGRAPLTAEDSEGCKRHFAYWKFCPVTLLIMWRRVSNPMAEHLQGLTRHISTAMADGKVSPIAAIRRACAQAYGVRRGGCGSARVRGVKSANGLACRVPVECGAYQLLDRYQNEMPTSGRSAAGSKNQGSILL
jgi:hypothetical protein